MSPLSASYISSEHGRILHRHLCRHIIYQLCSLLSHTAFSEAASAVHLHSPKHQNKAIVLSSFVHDGLQKTSPIYKALLNPFIPPASKPAQNVKPLSANNEFSNQRIHSTTNSLAASRLRQPTPPKPRSPNPRPREILPPHRPPIPLPTPPHPLRRRRQTRPHRSLARLHRLRQPRAARDDHEDRHDGYAGPAD